MRLRDRPRDRNRSRAARYCDDFVVMVFGDRRHAEALREEVPAVQLREIRGRFFRLPPKDDSYRSTNWEPLVPVDLPVFLAGLLTGQAAKHTQQRCACAHEHGVTGRYISTARRAATTGAATSRGECSALPGRRRYPGSHSLLRPAAAHRIW
jgi:hypothetical protein